MKKKSKTQNTKTPTMIVIDPEKHLNFASEEELFQHFKPQVDDIEKFYFDWREQFTKDIQQKDFGKYEKHLQACLTNPDEVLINSDITDQEIAIHISVIDSQKKLFYIAFCYTVEGEPSFIFLHFPTQSEELLNELRQRSDVLFNSDTKDVYPGAIEGDALCEGDELAKGHYKAMLTLRGEADIPQADFKNYADYREKSIEFADEIWRHSDSYGQNLVSFIKHYSDPENLYYVVVTLEDSMSDSNILLFSFPTLDESLLERYRVGENLQAEEVSQESSH